MSGIEDGSDKMKANLAFEYVAGTLRGDDRNHFEQQLKVSESLQKDVFFWEEQLMAIQNTQSELEPFESTWAAIDARVNPSAQVQKAEPFWRVPFWRFSTALLAFSWLVALTFVFVQDVNLRPNKMLNANYVAVLIDESGAPKLTAHTSQDGKKLWLKWDDATLKSDKSLQLWAQSRRDKQVRPIYIFEQANLSQFKQELSLNEANLRLIRDAEFLILTEEDAGGSPIDEPSDLLVAKGICVRLDVKS